MQVTLYGLSGADPSRHFSPHVWKVIMALHHKGIAFDFKPVSFTHIPEIEDGFSPTVPVLRHGNQLVRDSFDIALFLEDSYPDAPSLFGGDGGKGMARLIEGFSQNNIHPLISRIAIPDIYNLLAPQDRVYFRKTREPRIGQTIEEVSISRLAEVSVLQARFEPIRHALKHQPWLSGDAPRFADYILFGALQWLRVTSPVPVLHDGDPVREWFERCLNLHGGVGHSVTAAA